MAEDKQKAADTLSNYLVAGVAVGAIGVDFFSTPGEAPASFAEDSMLLAESLTLAGFFNYMAKVCFQRPRPILSEDETFAENHVSFYSGHTSLAAAMAATSSTLLFLRERPAAPYATAGLAALTLSVGALRIAAKKHYFSDVAVGLALGGLIGVAVPYLHNTNQSSGNGDSARSESTDRPIQFQLTLLW